TCQLPVRLDNFSEPQPDLALVARRDDFYRERHPGPPDTLLAIEVSDTTLRFDLQTKMSLYARHNIPELWVIDVKRKQLHVFRDPVEAGYREVLTATVPGVMPIASLPGVTVDLSSLSR